jgi:hypothetical protein
MCLIVFTPNLRRATIRKSILERGFDKNDDGAGFAYVHNGQVVVSKCYDTFPEFYAALKAARLAINDRGPLLIHFRWSSVGLNNRINTQPLVVRPGLVMAHNGTIDSLKPDCLTCDDSDSVRLARLVGRTDWQYPFAPINRALLKAICGDSSKLVFLDSNGRHVIINEQEGKWVRGAWYSDKGDVFEKPFAPYQGAPGYGSTPGYGATGYQPTGGPSAYRYEGDDLGPDEDELPTLSQRAAKAAKGLVVKQKPGHRFRAPNTLDNLSKGSKLDAFWTGIRTKYRLSPSARLDPDILKGADWTEWVNINNSVRS